MDYDLIALVLLWLVNILYVVGILPQIYLNYRLKTVRGLNDFMLLGYFLGYIFNVFYVHFYKINPLPVPYKVMMPCGLALIVVLITQRFYYNGYKSLGWLFSIYVFISIATILLIPFGLQYPDYVGGNSGWIAGVIWTIYMLPQMFKIYTEKSVKGFSFAFISILAVGVFIEFVLAIIRGFPWQTVFMALRGIVGYFIFCWLFWQFKDK